MDFKMKTVKVGMIVEGKVFKVTDESVYLDLETFADGVIHKKGLVLGDIASCKEIVKVGDILRAKINKIDKEDQQILLSRIDILRQEKVGHVKELANKNERIEAFVKKAGPNGLTLTYNGVDMFMPTSLIDIEKINPEDFQGKTLTCKVIESDNKRIVASRKIVLQEDLKVSKTEELKGLEVGKTLEGTVSRITKFGAFVSIGFNDGLVHISQISHHRVNDVNDVLKEGDKVQVEIVKIEKNRIGLSMKSLLKTPWQLFSEENKVGDKVTGTIKRKIGSGMFIELSKDVVGMLNSKDFSWDPRENLAGEVEVGDTLELQILSLDPEARRMALSKKHLDYNPWNDVSFKVNEEVSGVVEELQSRGALVKIQGVKAFLPISEIRDERVSQMSDVLKVGDVVNGIVLEIDKRQWKMKISLKQLVETKSRKEFEEYLKTEEKVQKQTLGDLFADKLKEFK